MPATIDEVSLVGEATPSFEAFYENTHARLYTALCLVTGSRHEAEEVMQDAFVRVWERWDRVGRLEEPTGYLYRAAMNLVRSRYRRASLALRRTVGLVAGAHEPILVGLLEEDLACVAVDAELLHDLRRELRDGGLLLEGPSGLARGAADEVDLGDTGLQVPVRGLAEDPHLVRATDLVELGCVGEEARDAAAHSWSVGAPLPPVPYSRPGPTMERAILSTSVSSCRASTFKPL